MFCLIQISIRWISSPLLHLYTKAHNLEHRKEQRCDMIANGDIQYA